MKTRIIIWMCIWLLGTASQGVLAGDVPLQKAVETGIALDYQHKNRVLESEKTELDLEKAKKNRWFSLDASGLYLFKSEQMEISLPGTQQMAGAPPTMKAGAKHNYDLKLGLKQPVYTGNIISNSISLQEQKLEADKDNTRVRKLEVAGQIKVSYFTYRLLLSKKASLDLLIQTLALHLKRVEDLYKEDLVKKSDFLETKMKLSEAQLKVESLNREIDVEQIRFKRLTSHHVGDIEENYQETVGSFAQSLQHFQQNHPILKRMNRQIGMVHIQKEIVSGSYLPQVGAFAELHYGKPGIDFFKNQWSLYFQGGLSVSMTLFDGNKKKLKRNKLDLSVRQINNRKDELTTEVKKGLNQLYTGLRSIESQVTIVKELTATAQEDALLKEALYKENQSPNIDYLTALLNKQRYESMQQELIFQGQLIKVNINIVTGNAVLSANDGEEIL